MDGIPNIRMEKIKILFKQGIKGLSLININKSYLPGVIKGSLANMNNYYGENDQSADHDCVSRKNRHEEDRSHGLMDAVVKWLTERLDEGEFVLPGFGKMVKVNRKERMGRNPATGESIKIPAKTVVKFRLAKAAKEAVM